MTKLSGFFKGVIRVLEGCYGLDYIEYLWGVGFECPYLKDHFWNCSGGSGYLAAN